MSTIQERNQSYRILFCYQGKRHSLGLGPVSMDEAEGKAGQIDLLLLRIKQGLLTVPTGVPIEKFMLHDGVVKTVQAARVIEPITFEKLRDSYLETIKGSIEENSLQTVTLHLKHFERSLGIRFPLQELTLGKLQEHILRRKGRSPVTLRKELASLRAMWNWGVQSGKLTGPFPNKGLRYPKGEDKPPFMTWKEIERKVSRQPEEADRLWNALFLQLPEIEQLLAFVKVEAAYPWIYPMVCFAAHTGARRSEILRMLTSDVDFEGAAVTIREKKKSRGQRTARRVPLSPFLAGVLQEWLKVHPGGSYLFCQNGVVPRSRKRSGTTGHVSKNRPTTKRERLATVKQRPLPGLSALSKQEAHDHFKRTLKGSKWERVRGWHVLRHSMASNCAAKGCDQRLIDAWLGHTTEIRKRYLHLIPSNEQQAIRSVFG